MQSKRLSQCNTRSETLWPNNTTILTNIMRTNNITPQSKSWSWAANNKSRWKWVTKIATENHILCSVRKNSNAIEAPFSMQYTFRNSLTHQHHYSYKQHLNASAIWFPLAILNWSIGNQVQYQPSQVHSPNMIWSRLFHTFMMPLTWTRIILTL